MSTAIAEPGSLMVMTAASVTPKAFDVDVESIKGKATQYQSLKVNGLADKLGLKTVREARFELARVRCDIEKRRQEIKAGALAFGKAVDAEAKRLTALVEPTEQALKAIEDDIAKEEQREKDKRTAERMKLLSAVDSRYPEVVVAAMPDKDFDKLLAELTADHERRKEESRLKAEQEAAERAQRQADEAEKKRVADDELAARREELRKQEAVRNQREAQEAEQRRQADAEMAAEREALRKQREAQEDEQRRLDKIRTEQEQAERAKLQEAEAERSRKAEAERQARDEQE